MSIVKVVNAMPNDHSNEQNQDSEPSIAVNPNNPSEIVLTAFTPPDNGQTGGPIYYSNDGGSTFFLYFDIPGGEPGDQSVGFASTSNELYSAVLRGDIFKQLAVSRTDNPPVNSVLPALDAHTNIDQPWVESRSVIGGGDSGKDRLYVGYNNDNAGLGNPSATVDVCLDALNASPTFNSVLLEHRTVGSGLLDGYAIRPVAHYDGTVYAIYEGWRSGSFGADITTDIVVARDDNWGNGSPPFQALIDPDAEPGKIVQSGVVINDGGVMGQERLNNDLAIAVDPTSSNMVYIAWCDNAGPNYTLRVRRSATRGVNWSGDLLTVDNATMAGLAINVAGQVGLMYQQLNGSNWETHLRRTTDSSGMNWNDLLLCTAPSATPVAQGQPYLGDWARVVAVGHAFYGVFCANNTPDPANFPEGVTFQRNHTTSAPYQLLGTDNSTVIPVSIDPFFFSVTDLAPASDFYVRDWTDSASSGDNGAEPSTQSDFYSTSDVWNQYSSSTPFAPNSNDQILGEDASSGSDSGAVNYAFARIRRNTLPASGSGSTSVSAHFLVSEFGTGSNFTDWVFADPSDPDVTFPAESDVSVSFADTELGPKITPPFQWNLGPTSSNHLCLAVEITSPGDPFATPGLTGRAPGSTDVSVVTDNNKAQHNLQIYLSGHGSHGATYYGIIHNAGLDTQDLALQVGGAGRAPAGATLEIVTTAGSVQKRPWRPWETIALPGMLPGENRWLGVTIPTPAGSDARVPVNISELRGNLIVNGFAIAAQPASNSDVITSNLIFHQTVFGRLNLGFGIGRAPGEVSAAGSFPPSQKKHHADHDAGVNIEQDVSVSSHGMKIEVHLRITEHGDLHHHAPAASQESATSYQTFVEGRVSNIQECLTALLKTTTISDVFGIGQTICDLQAATDEVGLLTAHSMLLHKFDAFMTMLQKSKGDRADILQNVRWQIHLYTASSVLSAFSEASAIVAQSRAYVAAVEARTARIGDYGSLLAGLGTLFDQTSAHLPGLNLQPLIQAIAQATYGRAQQYAHRQFLLRLQAGV